MFDYWCIFYDSYRETKGVGGVGQEVTISTLGLDTGLLGACFNRLPTFESHFTNLLKCVCVCVCVYNL